MRLTSYSLYNLTPEEIALVEKPPPQNPENP